MSVVLEICSRTVVGPISLPLLSLPSGRQAQGILEDLLDIRNIYGKYIQVTKKTDSVSD